jgi:hypothetical protein
MYMHWGGAVLNWRLLSVGRPWHVHPAQASVLKQDTQTTITLYSLHFDCSGSAQH